MTGKPEKKKAMGNNCVKYSDPNKKYLKLRSLLATLFRIFLKVTKVRPKALHLIP